MFPGKVVAGRYEIKNHIGRGGMQDVYLAIDRLLDLEVALKTPQVGQQAKRFKNSAVIAAKINHHNVAKTLDYVEEDENQYLIEEYVPGETLDKKLKSFGFLDPHLAARVFHNLSKGLYVSHKAGVIHRDIKPSNIIVTGGVNLNELKITDFGIATLTAEVFEDEARAGELTRSTSGTVKGALPFMSPEMMFRSQGDIITTSADIWSFGAMMYLLLTGDFPFGVFLEAAVNVSTKKRKPWPDFMVRNRQFAPLANQLKRIAESCLEYDPKSRPSAENLVKLFQEMCYLSVDRQEGEFSHYIQNGYSGFINRPSGNVFFSRESIYGASRPDNNENSRICFSSFPGAPKERAHPIVILKKNK
jgi:serine/threonine-protein kinase